MVVKTSAIDLDYLLHLADRRLHNEAKTQNGDWLEEARLEHLLQCNTDEMTSSTCSWFAYGISSVDVYQLCALYYYRTIQDNMSKLHRTDFPWLCVLLDPWGTRCTSADWTMDIQCGIATREKGQEETNFMPHKWRSRGKRCVKSSTFWFTDCHGGHMTIIILVVHHPYVF